MGKYMMHLVFSVGLIKKANKEIILIDSYANINTLNILCKKIGGVYVDAVQ